MRGYVAVYCDAIMSWYHPSLEKFSNVVFIVMCLVVTAVGVQRFTGAGAGAAPAPRPPAAPPFAAGTKLALHPSLTTGSSRASIVVALSTTCQFCTASMPFYRRLADQAAASDGRIKVGVVGLQPEVQIREYMAGNGLAVRTVIDLREAGVPVQATPTLLIVNGAGEVTRSWAGRLRPDEEEAVMSELKRLGSS